MKQKNSLKDTNCQSSLKKQSKTKRDNQNSSVRIKKFDFVAKNFSTKEVPGPDFTSELFFKEEMSILQKIQELFLIIIKNFKFVFNIISNIK